LVDGENCHLVEFFDIDELARLIIKAANDEHSPRIRKAARSTVLTKYDLRRHCMPAYLSLLNRLAETRPLARR
jgi:glycosyltransferase involved in cell wall biosynthesis